MPRLCDRCKEELKKEVNNLERYEKSKGDRDLWNKYSHVEVIEIIDGEEVVSRPYLIVAIYRYAGGISVNHNKDNGSANWVGMKKHNRKKDVYILPYGGNTHSIKLLERKSVYDKTTPQE